jgi:transcriptional regulator with XRE-family HTH domain
MPAIAQPSLVRTATNDNVLRRSPAPCAFGLALRRRRVAARLTQEQLAARAGLSARAVGDIERGRVRYPRPESVRLLGRALGQAGPELDAFLGLARAEYWAGRARGEQAAVPAQLPLDVRGFTGRQRELGYLDALLDGVGGSGSVVVSAIVGVAGVGKTALAVHWAHRVAARFGDGQLYLDLHGYDGEPPMAPGDALTAMLLGLGVRGADLPPDLTARTGQFRSLLAGRHMLLVLDNARDTEQVRLLLPGTGSCLVLVTSRDRLAGLVARHGAWRVGLGPLPMPDAVGLLLLLIGDRVAAEPHATVQLADLCARLPLALRIAAERATARPSRSLAALVAELAGERAAVRSGAPR